MPSNSGQAPLFWSVFIYLRTSNWQIEVYPFNCWRISEEELREMDLDNWIAKVKEGQHLSEDELQLLCEYVCPPSSDSIFAFLSYSVCKYIQAINNLIPLFGS